MSTPTPNTLSSIELRQIIETLDLKVGSTQATYLRAEDSYASATREHALRGEPCDRPSLLAGVERCRTEHNMARDSLAEAKRLLAESQAREAAEAEQVARDEVAALILDLLAAAEDADAAYSAFIEKYLAARSIETKAQRLCRDRLGNEVFGSILPTALGEAARHLTAARNGNITEVEAWTKTFAEKAADGIRRAAKL